MIAKIMRGSRTYGLLRYLYGPGTHEEHVDPHLVASWNGLEPDPARVPQASLRALAEVLDQPVRMQEMELGREIRRHVWHCPVRAAPTDRILSDAEWADIARDAVTAAGLVGPDAEGGCRWIAVRHADDHIHIVATLARADGQWVQHHNDAYRVRAAMRVIESRYGLRSTAPADHTAARNPTRQELGKASRRGLREVTRVSLQQTVRAAAVAAVDEADFFDRLEKAGLRIRKRSDPSSGAVLGYAVAQPGDRNAAGEPVWYAGSRLAPDLSLPKVRARWARAAAADEANAPVDVAVLPPTERAGARAQAWRTAADAVHDAARTLSSAGDADGAATVAALGDMLTAAAQQSPASIRRQLTAAARQFERASRAPVARQTSSSSAANLQLAVRSLEAAGRALNSRQEAAAAFILMVAAIAAVMAAYRWHQTRNLTAQASAAAAAGARLRMAAGLTAYNGDVSAPFDSVAAENPRYIDAARSALAGHIDPEAVLADPAWPALAYTLRKADERGYSPAEVLAEVAGERELDSARSPAEVLTWRMQRWLAKHADDATVLWAKYGPAIAETIGLGAEELRTPELVTALRAADAGGMDTTALCRTLETRQSKDIDEDRRDERPQDVSRRAAAEIRGRVERFHADGATPAMVRRAWERYEPIVMNAVGEDAAFIPWQLRTERLVEALQRAEQAGLDLPGVCAAAVAADGGRPSLLDARSPEQYADALAGRIEQQLPASVRPASPATERPAVDAQLLLRAAELVIAEQFPNRSMVQRKFALDYDQAQQVMAGLEAAGVISAVKDGPFAYREILMNADEARAALSVPQADSPTDHNRFAEIARSALNGVRDPGEIDALIADPAWPTLAGLLQEAEQSGHDPVALLGQVAQPRAVDSVSKAKSLAAVLSWRIRHHLEETRSSAPATPTTADAKPTRAASRGASRQRPETGPQRGRGR